MANKMQHFQHIIQEQSTPQYRNIARHPKGARINFAPPRQPPGPKYDFLMENDAIDAWNTNTYSREEDIRGLRRLMESHKKKKKNAINFINRAAITSRSWNAERERLLHLRKQMHMPTPVFQPTTQPPKEAGILTYLKTKKEAESQTTKNNSTSESSRSFKYHKKLLSRIYSHSYEPQMMIKRVAQPRQIEDKHEPKFMIPSIKFRKTVQTSSKTKKELEENEEDCQYWQVRKLMKQKQVRVKLSKTKSAGWETTKKQQLKIV